MRAEQQQRHISLVRELSTPGRALDATGPNATVNNPTWFYLSTGVPRRERAQLHARLKQTVMERYPEAKGGRRALVLAGPPGAGKGSVAQAVLGDDLDSFVTVDADEFKKLLLREALADGSYEAWIKPDAVRDLEEQGERFFPLELAALVHEESSMLAAALREDLIATETNVVVDAVLGTERSALDLGDRLAEAGYHVTVVDVEVPYEVSKDRIVQRWQEAMWEAETGDVDALGGRWVPSEYARLLFDTEHGRSKSQDVAKTLAEKCPAVMRYELYYTSLEEHRASQQEQRPAVPVQEVAMERRAEGTALTEAPLEGSPVLPASARLSFPGSAREAVRDTPNRTDNRSSARPSPQGGRDYPKVER